MNFSSQFQSCYLNLNLINTGDGDQTNQRRHYTLIFRTRTCKTVSLNTVPEFSNCERIDFFLLRLSYELKYKRRESPEPDDVS